VSIDQQLNNVPIVPGDVKVRSQEAIYQYISSIRIS